MCVLDYKNNESSILYITHDSKWNVESILNIHIQTKFQLKTIVITSAWYNLYIKRKIDFEKYGIIHFYSKAENTKHNTTKLKKFDTSCDISDYIFIIVNYIIGHDCYNSIKNHKISLFHNSNFLSVFLRKKIVSLEKNLMPFTTRTRRKKTIIYTKTGSTNAWSNALVL